MSFFIEWDEAHFNRDEIIKKLFEGVDALGENFTQYTIKFIPPFINENGIEVFTATITAA